MDSTVRDTFDRLASEYDELKLKIIPGYREIQELVLGHSGSADSVLELGCGTGEWAAMFLERHPEAEYSAIEFSEQMRSLAATRLDAHGDRFQLIDQNLDSPLPEGGIDLVVSFFAIHHVQDKARLFSEVFDRLRPQGRLIFADITVAAEPELEQQNLDDWIAFMRDSGLEEEQIPYVLDDHRDNDLPETVARQLEFLESAGFADAEVAWSRGKYVMIVASKGETG
jgi:ubiquinone/menaquinone biosynthesis C-methylase UbiE